MKTLMIFIIISLIPASYLFAQPQIGYAEILIKNYTNHDVLMKLFPIGAVFSGFYTPEQSTFRKYSLKRSNLSADPFWPRSPSDSQMYIVGGVKTIGSNDYALVDFDDGLYYDDPENADRVVGGVSYGLWRFEFYYSESGPPHTDLIADCFIDYRDINHGQGATDIYFELVRRSGALADSLLFSWEGGYPVNILDSRINYKVILDWHKVGVTGDPITSGSPNRGLFKTLPTFFHDYPIDATDYGAVSHIDPEEIGMNLEIDSSGTKLTTGNNLVFSDCNLTIKDGKNFILESNANLVFESFSKFRTFNSSGRKTITMGSNSSIVMNPNSSLNLNNTIFQTTNGSITWKGIKLTDTNSDTINNCLFKNTDTCINLYNSGKCIARYTKVVTGSKFENGIVKLRNIFNALISNDTFNSTNNSHYLLYSQQ